MQCIQDVELQPLHGAAAHVLVAPVAADSHTGAQHLLAHPFTENSTAVLQRGIIEVVAPDGAVLEERRTPCDFAYTHNPMAKRDEAEIGAAAATFVRFDKPGVHDARSLTQAVQASLAAQLLFDPTFVFDAVLNHCTC